MCGIFCSLALDKKLTEPATLKTENNIPKNIANKAPFTPNPNDTNTTAKTSLKMLSAESVTPKTKNLCKPLKIPTLNGTKKETHITKAKIITGYIEFSFRNL